MKKIRVCFIGVGSIAKRHIKNLKKISFIDGIEIKIDVVSKSGVANTKNINNYIDCTFNDVEELQTVYDAIFITNPTKYHICTLKKVTPYGKNFFIEKPIATISQINEVRCYQEKSDAVYYVACPLRYNAVIQYIKNNIVAKDIISVRSISSSYLPDCWRFYW